MSKPELNLTKNDSRSDVEKWDECCKSGLTLLLGGVALGSCASIATMTPFPFLVLSSIGLYSAVENCDNIFRERSAQNLKAEIQQED